MEIKERYTIIILISFIVGVFLLNVFSFIPIYYFVYNSVGYFFFDLQILVIIILLNAYFTIRPIKTLRGKKNIALGAMIFGSILVLFPVIAISLDTYRIYFVYEEIFFWFYFGPILSLVLLVPGVALYVHGWFLKKRISSKEKRKLIEMKIKERNAIFAILSFVAGAFLLIITVHILIVTVLYNPSYGFSRLYGYLFIDLLILAIPLFFYAHFLLKPMKTLRGKKILARGAMIFGGILIFFLIVGIGFELNYRFFYGYDFSVIDSLNIALCFVILMPSIILLIQGWLLRKSIEEDYKNA